MPYASTILLAIALAWAISAPLGGEEVADETCVGCADRQPQGASQQPDPALASLAPVQDLLPLLAGGARHERLQALVSLEQRPGRLPPEAVESLLAVAGDQDATLATRAARLLAQRWVPGAEEQARVLDLLRGAATPARTAALGAVQHLAGPDAETLATLRRFATGEDRQLQNLALSMLTRWRDRVVPDLLRDLAASDPAIRLEALRILALLHGAPPPEARTTLLELARTGEDGRALAVTLLARQATWDEASSTVILAAVGELPLPERIGVVRALGFQQAEAGRIRPVLLAALATGERPLLANLLDALQRLGPADEQALRLVLDRRENSADAELRAGLLLCAAALSPPLAGCSEGLVARLSEGCRQTLRLEDERLAARGAQAIGHLPGVYRELRPDLAALLQRGLQARQAALQAYARLGKTAIEDLPLLLALPADPSLDVVVLQAIAAVGRDDTRAWYAVTERLAADDPRLVDTASDLLSQRPDGLVDLAPQLIAQITRQGEPRLALRGWELLPACGQQARAAVMHLLPLLEDPQTRTRACAIVERLGPLAEEARATLTRLAADRDLRLRLPARRALAALDD